MGSTAAKAFASIGRRLEGKVALITGGSSGIGATTAKWFHKHGARVVIADIQEDLGNSVCNEIGSNAALFVHCDVTEEQDTVKSIEATIKKFGKLDIMFNNAAIIDPPKPGITDNEITDFKRVMDVNVNGVFLGIKHAARVMIPEKRGSIIINGSVGSVIGGVESHAYVASKHAVVGLMKNAAVDLGKYGIRVNCISPFVLASSLAKDFFGKDEGEIENWVSGLANLKRAVLTAEDVAKAAVYFASDESKYVSGHNFVIDGGFSTAINGAFGLFKQNN